MSKKILMIDDEPMIVESVSYSLRQEGYEVITANHGDEGFRLAENEKVDLILLDLMLPGMNGLDICRAIRQHSEVPIIILTAKEGEIDRVLGLELGADDYVTKPFSIRELIARVRTVLKRYPALNTGGGESAESQEIFHYGDLAVDFPGHELSVKGKPINLSGKEFELLKILIQHPGQVLSREQLLNLVWGSDFYGGDRTVDVHIRWLREKIEDDPGEPKYIITVRGAGYKFNRIPRTQIV
jgi:DNA-binding response OmpR family regulator